ncbi:unnamed protein product [Fraxinus pennsylvanica]|uniref:Uncharacterized protein n=1 Tax=Fraxinus pennsylvanica TaxID=56036 RepID=A0AAD1Z634_9LAMI|nr:unnamed protein product [Fraxinus pennsylvanica]
MDSPLTSFSRRLSSNFTGSDPCSRFKNSSASKLGRTAALRRDELLPPSLNDADIVKGVACGASLGRSLSFASPKLSSGVKLKLPSPETSSMSDLYAFSFAHQIHKTPNFIIPPV